MVEVFRSAGELEKLSMPELVELYNSLRPGRKVSKFSSHAVGIQRCLKLLAKQHEWSIKKFNCPCLKHIHVPDPGTQCEMAEIYLHRGATREELQSLTGWDMETVGQVLKDLHFVWGYGLKEHANGIIRLVEA